MSHPAVLRHPACAPSRRALGVALGLAALLGLFGVSRLDESALSALQAYAELGLVSGSRCLARSAYVYDPRRERPDPLLFTDPAEQPVIAQLEAALETPGSSLAGFEVERVQADIVGGPATVWAILRLSDQSEQRWVYTLQPERFQRVSLDLPHKEIMLCNKAIGQWRLDGERPA